VRAAEEVALGLRPSYCSFIQIFFLLLVLVAVVAAALGTARSICRDCRPLTRLPANATLIFFLLLLLYLLPP